MPKIPGIPHLRAVRALENAGFQVARQGKHIVMTDGRRIVTIPRHDPVDALSMGGIVRDGGLTPHQFRQLLRSYSPAPAPVVRKYSVREENCLGNLPM